jgi:hypothetical protein
MAYSESAVEDPSHFTKISIWNLNRALNTRTLGKVRQFLASMYRFDIRDAFVRILWQSADLIWDDGKEKWLTAPDGTSYHKEF